MRDAGVHWAFAITLAISGCFNSHDGAGDDSSGSSRGEPDGPADYHDAEPDRPVGPDGVIVPGVVIAGCQDICERLGQCTGENVEECTASCIEASAVNASDECDRLMLNVIECAVELDCSAFLYGEGPPRGCEEAFAAFDSRCDFPEDDRDGDNPLPPPYPYPEDGRIEMECQETCDHFAWCQGEESYSCYEDCVDAAYASDIPECKNLFFQMTDCIRSLSCAEIRGRDVEETGCRPLFEAWDRSCEESDHGGGYHGYDD